MTLRTWEWLSSSLVLKNFSLEAPAQLAASHLPSPGELLCLTLQRAWRRLSFLDQFSGSSFQVDSFGQRFRKWLSESRQRSLQEYVGG